MGICVFVSRNMGSLEMVMLLLVSLEATLKRCPRKNTPNTSPFESCEKENPQGHVQFSGDPKGARRMHVRIACH